MRAVFEALGIQDIVAKSVGTSNPHNMVRATFEALKSASSPKIIAISLAVLPSAHNFFNFSMR